MSLLAPFSALGTRANSRIQAQDFLGNHRVTVFAPPKRAGFDARQGGIDIAELNTRSYAAAHTGAPMFAVQMIVNVPTRIHLSSLREEFLELCDNLNLDAILEPVKM